jgi:hypothetical protein
MPIDGRELTDRKVPCHAMFRNLEEAMHKEIDLRGLTKRGGKKRPQPEGLRRVQQARKKAA